MLVRGSRIDRDTYNPINVIINKRRARGRTWHFVEDKGSNRQMKYKHSSHLHKEWENEPTLKRFLCEMKAKVNKQSCI